MVGSFRRGSIAGHAVMVGQGVQGRGQHRPANQEAGCGHKGQEQHLDISRIGTEVRSWHAERNENGYFT